MIPSRGIPISLRLSKSFAGGNTRLPMDRYSMSISPRRRETLSTTDGNGASSGSLGSTNLSRVAGESWRWYWPRPSMNGISGQRVGWQSLLRISRVRLRLYGTRSSQDSSRLHLKRQLRRLNSSSTHSIAPIASQTPDCSDCLLRFLFPLSRRCLPNGLPQLRPPWIGINSQASFHQPWIL